MMDWYFHQIQLILRRTVYEPWLAINRLMTVFLLGWRLRRRRKRMHYVPEQGSMLYVAASALPYHTSGYTTRTHELIRSLRSVGATVHVLTRPGYPWDRKDRQKNAMGNATMVDDVLYQHAQSPANNRPVWQYALQAAKVVADMAVQHRVSVIHAASNHVNALPAMLAARQLGIPFQYEMRGVWELTRISRMKEYEGSQSYQQGLQLEALVARHADKLFVISDELGNYAQQNWGVDLTRMILLPNCVDPKHIVAADPQAVRLNTIGYAGSLMSYEGLDTLIDAVNQLTHAGCLVKVVIIGDGEERSVLESLVQHLGLTEQIQFLGKMPPDEARKMLGRCALVCIPRKPFKVCKIVPPIKLVEALAMGKPVIVPDLPVFRDEMGVEPTGWFFNGGDSADLARVIQAALADQGLLAAMGERARTYACTKRSWKDYVIHAMPLAEIED
jgi:glycosyltransferase involved in cell wall biosynthesis